MTINKTPAMNSRSQLSSFLCHPPAFVLNFGKFYPLLEQSSVGNKTAPQHVRFGKSLSAATPVRGQSSPVCPTGSCANSHFPHLDSKHVSITPTPGQSISSPISCSKITASSTALMSGLSRALDRNSTACNTAGGREKKRKKRACFPYRSVGEPLGAHCPAPGPQTATWFPLC